MDKCVLFLELFGNSESKSFEQLTVSIGDETNGALSVIFLVILDLSD